MTTLDPEMWDHTDKDIREVVLRGALLMARNYRYGTEHDYIKGGNSRELVKREIRPELASETLARIRDRWAAELDRRKEPRRKIQPIRG